MTYDNVRPVSRAELARHGLYVAHDNMPVLRIVQPDADAAPEPVEGRREPLTIVDRFWLWVRRRMGL